MKNKYKPIGFAHVGREKRLTDRLEIIKMCVENVEDVPLDRRAGTSQRYSATEKTSSVSNRNTWAVIKYPILTIRGSKSKK